MLAEYKMIGGDGREYGPATLEEIRLWCEEGRVGHGTPVWRSDEQRWQPAGGWDELKWDLPKLPPTPAVTPSQAQAGQAAPALGVRPAGFWLRLAAMIVDWVVIEAIVSLISLPWADQLAKLQKLQESAAAQLKTPTPDMDLLMQVGVASFAILGAYVVLAFAYVTFFNGWRGATPGKQLLGLRVLDEDGVPLGYPRALLRCAAGLLSLLPFGAGFVMIGFNPAKRALHDLLVRTQVIRTKW